LEGVPYTPNPGSEKSDTKSETSVTKKRNKSTAAYSVGETLFKAEAPHEAPKKETTFWERKDAEPTPEADMADLIDATEDHIAERQMTVQAELAQADPQSIEAATAASDAALLENAQWQFAQAETADVFVPEAALDIAYEQTVAEIDHAVASVENTQDTPRLNEATEPTSQAGGGEQPPPIDPPTPERAYAAEEPPEPPAFRVGQQIPTPGAYAERTVPERTATAVAEGAYRRGRSDGLFTGSVLGFLYGKHRGRKKAEKRFKPIQERLEGQLKSITDKLGRHEQDVRSLTAKKLEQVPTASYQQVTERLAPEQPVMQEKPIAEMMPPRPAPDIEAMPLPPMAPLAEVATAQSESQLVTPTAAELAVSRSEYAGIVPFNTSEQMTSKELKAIAEKVIIDHVSLKDMYESQQFDEKGLRRIVNEFLRGGDVQRAITSEVVRKDKAFELDPRLRRQQINNEAKGGGSSGTIDGQYKELPSGAEPSRKQQLLEQTKRLPELGQAAIHDLKKRQIASVAGVTLVVIIAILLALWATS
jgi:hypothetical protein